MKILKFGGSSVADANAIKQVKTILENRKDEQLLVIFSAFKGMTNALIESGEMAAAGKVEYREVCQRIRDKHMEVLMALIPTEDQERAHLWHISPSRTVIENQRSDLELWRAIEWHYYQ